MVRSTLFWVAVLAGMLAVAAVASAVAAGFDMDCRVRC